MNILRRTLLKSFLVATPAIALTKSAFAAPNGTRPTVLSGVSVVAASRNQIRVSGRYTTLTGAAIPGMRVDIYSVFEASFARWATAYTDGAGNFSVAMPKMPAGSQIQIEVVGNDAYSRPYPTFATP